MAVQSSETERIRRLYEKEAPKYDRQMRFCDRVLFAGAREWVCSQVEGDVLEIAVGTGAQPLSLPTGGPANWDRVQSSDARHRKETSGAAWPGG